ncbi:MAG TPA: 5'/3'-nucleotidase SurE [Anaerolineae bacterium]|nr:5'/3'-nucleotidase SurE [Anaerolineae bacterium]
MPARPLILITNDDGIKSPGLRAAAEVCEALGEILIVAPAHQQSGAGRSMPATSEGRIYAEEVPIKGQKVIGYGVEGTPAQVVQHALFEIAQRPVNLVVSGINYGENIGEGITVSGTVGAALEAASFGVPALAASRQTAQEHYLSHSAEIDFSAAAHFLQKVTAAVLQRGLPAGVDLLKIEVPQHATTNTPTRWTRLSRQRYFYPIVPHRRRPSDPGPLGYETRVELDTLELDSDVRAVIVDKVVSITPVSVDLTARVDFGQMQAWLDQRGDLPHDWRGSPDRAA